MSRFYYYERNLTFTKQLQRFIVFLSIWMASFYLGSLLVPKIISWNLLEQLKILSVAFLLKAVSIVTLFKLRKSSLHYQQNILVYNSGACINFIQDVLQLKRTGLSIHKAQKELFKKSALDKLLQTVDDNKIQAIYIPLEIALKKSNSHILNLSWDKQVKLNLVANYDAPITWKKAQFFGVSQVSKLYTSPLDSLRVKTQKRVFDIVFSTIVIVGVLSWFVPLLAIMIRLDSKGPTFFIQNRPGKANKPFPCMKFRSMTINNTTEKKASRNDIRVTRLGKFIRKTSLDELPQFFNVFLGHMSVVGPRPNLTSQYDYYSEVFEDYDKRTYLKPGITGLAQVSGARGGVENDIEMKHRIKYDIFYVRHWSFALDIKIIIRTVINIIKGEDKAY